MTDGGPGPAVGEIRGMRIMPNNSTSMRVIIPNAAFDRIVQLAATNGRAIDDEVAAAFLAGEGAAGGGGTGG